MQNKKGFVDVCTIRKTLGLNAYQFLRIKRGPHFPRSQSHIIDGRMADMITIRAGMTLLRKANDFKNKGWLLPDTLYSFDDSFGSDCARRTRGTIWPKSPTEKEVE